MERGKRKTIKLAIVNFWPGFDFLRTTAYSLLSKHFDVLLDKDNPDFVISSVFGNINSVLKYPCARIRFVGEPISTDFSLFDYSIDFDFAEVRDGDWNDRHFRLPLGFCGWHNELPPRIATPPTKEEAEKLYANKSKFCNFIYGHKSQLGMRESLLEAIEKYKHVDSAGRYENNMPDGQAVTYAGNKLAFMNDYRFSIACESIAFPGFVTEKIVHAFYARSIPIYFGDPLVTKTYNPESFVNVCDYPSLDEVVARVAAIDNDKDLFVQMLCADKFAPGYHYNEIMQRYEDFLVRVFSQDPNRAIRRQLYYSAEQWENELRFRFDLIPPKPNFWVRGCKNIKRRFRKLIYMHRN